MKIVKRDKKCVDMRCEFCGHSFSSLRQDYFNNDGEWDDDNEYSCIEDEPCDICGKSSSGWENES